MSKDSFDVKLNVDDFQQGSDKVVKFTKQMKEALNDLSNVKSLEQLQNANDKFTQNIKGGTSLIQAWRGSLNDAGTAINYVKGQLSSIDQTQLSKSFQAETVKNYGDALQSVGTKLQWTGRQISIGLTEPIIEFGKEAVNSFLAFNKQITDIQVNLMQMKQTASGPIVDKSGFDLSKVNSDVKTLTGNFAETKAESAGLINDLTQMGFGLQKVNVEGIKSKDLSGGMAELASKMALIGHMSPDAATKGIVALDDAFVKGAPGIRTASDELSRTQLIMNQLSAEATKGKISLTDILEVLPQLSAVTDKTNTSTAAMVAVMGAAAQAGEQPQQMVNTLQQSFTRLFSPTNAKGLGELANLHLHLFDDQGKAVGMLSIVTQLAQKTGEMTDANKTALASIFGFRQTDNLTKFLRGFTQDTSDANQMLKQAGIDGPNALAALAGGEANLGTETAKTLQQLANQRLATVQASPAFKFDQMKADVKNAITTIGESIATGIEPILRKFVDFFTKIADGFEKLPQAAKSFIVIGALAIAAVGPIAMMGGVFMQFVGVFIKGIGDIMNHYNGLSKIKDIDIANFGGKQQLIDAYKREGKAVFEAADGQLMYSKNTDKAAASDIEAKIAADAKAKAQFQSPGRISIQDAPQIKQKYKPQPGESVKDARDRVKALEDEGKAAEQDASKLENLGAKTSIFSSLSGKVKSVIQNIIPGFKDFGSKGAAASTEVEGGLSGLASKVPLLGGVFESIGPAIIAFLAPIGAAIAAVGAPIIAVAAVIAAAIAIVVTHWKDFINGIKTGFAPFKSAFDDFKNIFKPIGDAWNQLTAIFKNKDAENAFTALGTVAKWLGEIIGEQLGMAFKVLSTVFKPILSALSGAFSTALKIIGDVIKVVIDLINGEWVKAAKQFADIFISAIAFILQPFQIFIHIMADGLSMLVSMIEKIANAGSHLPIIGGAMKSVANDLKGVSGQLHDIGNTDFLGNIQKGLDKDLDVNGKVKVSSGTKDSAQNAGADIGQTMAQAAQNKYEQEFGQFDPTGSNFAGKVKAEVQKDSAQLVTDANKQVADAQAAQQRGLENAQSAESKALDVKASAETKALDESTSNQKKALDEQITQQSKALDEQISAESKAYDRMQQEQQKAFDRMQQEQSKAYDRQQQAQQNEFDREQQAEKDALTASQKAQVDAIDAQIKAIDDLSNAEDNNLREEEYRTHRLELLQSQQENNENYLRDRAVAIYEGKVDDARKLDLQHTKNVQDTNKQIADLDAQHGRDEVKAQRDIEKEKLDDQKTFLQQQFDAQKQALDQKLQNEKDAFTQELQNEKDAFTQQLQDAKDAYSQQLQDQKDAFQKIEQDKKDAFQKQAQDEKDALDASIQRQKDAQTAQIAAQKDALDKQHAQQKDALDKQLADQKQNLDDKLKAITDHVPRNVAEMQSEMDQIHKVLADAGITWKGDATSGQDMFNGAIESGAQQLRDDNFWAGIGYAIVGGLVQGGNQASNAFLNTLIAQNPGVAQVIKNPFGFHTGGAVGSPNESAEDVPVTLQVGEYVIQRSAVQALGTNFLSAINQGMIPQKKYHSGGNIDKSSFVGPAGAISMLNSVSGLKASSPSLTTLAGADKSIQRVAASQIAAAFGMPMPFFHSGGLVKAMRNVGVANSTVQGILSDAKSNARSTLQGIVGSQTSILAPSLASQGSINSVSSSTTNINMSVDTFIGQKEWFEDMMKEYNIKVMPKLNRAQGLESRSIKEYS